MGIKLPKLGLVACRVSKHVQGRILNAAVSQAPSGKNYVSLCCTDVIIPQPAKTGAAVGIDLGLAAIAMTSYGEDYPNNRYLRESTKKLVREQRRLSRKTIGSANRDKQRFRVAKIHERVANQRNDSIHNMTAGLVRGYDFICEEDFLKNNLGSGRPEVTLVERV